MRYGIYVPKNVKAFHFHLRSSLGIYLQINNMRNISSRGLKCMECKTEEKGRANTDMRMQKEIYNSVGQISFFCSF